MPNHIYNVIRFEGQENEVKRIMSDIQLDSAGPGTIDFNKIIPMPENVYRGPLGKKEREKYPNELNWYDWSIKHWGTKFNAYDFEAGVKGDDSLVFHTAWSSVPRVLEVLSEKYPDVRMEYSWADEDFGANTGTVTFKAGEVESLFIPADHSKEAIEFAAALQDAKPEDFGFVFNEKENAYMFDYSVLEDNASFQNIKPKSREER